MPAVNRDGLFFDRLLPAAIAATFSAAVTVGAAGLFFWKDTAKADGVQAEQIAQMKVELIDQKLAIGDLRKAVEQDRQKTYELSADVKMIGATTARTERLLDSVSTRLERVLEQGKN